MLSITPIVLATGTILFRLLEGWTWAQSFYFTVITITTVGYGDLHPSNDTSRLVTALFILFGVGLVLAAISYTEVRYVDARNKNQQKDAEKH